MSLNSSDPWEAPLIDPNFLGSTFDVHVVLQAVKAARKFLTGTAWNGFVEAPYGDFANATTDAQLEAYARDNARGVWHAVGTAAISPEGVSWGVVNPDYTVKGTAGLRVIDASVIPFVPSGHTQGVVYIFAERAAALIAGH